MIGLALLAVGAVCIWAAFTGRADHVFQALAMSLPTIGAGNAIVTPGDGSSSGSSSGGSSESSGDSGQHMGLTDGGLAYIITKPYADMTDAEKHDANNYAHNNDNLASNAG